MTNKEIARVFKTIADILEINDENFFRIRAYRTAAQNIENLTEDLSILVKEDRLSVPGVGADLAQKIKEMLTTGALAYFEDLKKTIPEGVIEIMAIPGVGPKTAKLLFDKLGISSIDALEKAAKDNKITDVFGLKEKTQENILKGISFLRQGRQNMLLRGALDAADKIINSLKTMKEIKEICPAGSLRRKKETVRDIDILAACAHPEKVMRAFTSLAFVQTVTAQGAAKLSIINKDGVQVDLRVVNSESFGAALCYFTGSKEHNIHIRELAKKKGLKINEYGVFNENNGECIAGKTEKEVYKALGLEFIEPELRQDTGEIEAAQKNGLPELITLEDIKTDTHIHSEWSDGADSILTMAQAARGRGYEYMVLSDHSQSLGIAKGLSPARLNEQIDEVKKINKKLDGFKILCAAEVDIKADGSLDFDDELLKKLDVVLAAIHSGFKQSRAQITNRLIKAMESKYVNIIAHPSGRLINERPAYDYDFEVVLAAAKRTNTALEINCYPKRLDLDDTHARRAKEEGVMLALGSDSHSIEQLDYIKFGVFTARRGWLEKKDTLNCLSCDDFLKRIKK